MAENWGGIETGLSFLSLKRSEHNSIEAQLDVAWWWPLQRWTDNWADSIIPNTINRWESLHPANGIMVDPAESFGPSLNGLVQLATCRIPSEWTHKKPIGTGNNLNDSLSLLVYVGLCLPCNSHSISGFAFFFWDEDNGCKDPSFTAPEPSGCSRFVDRYSNSVACFTNSTPLFVFFAFCNNKVLLSRRSTNSKWADKDKFRIFWWCKNSLFGKFEFILNLLLISIPFVKYYPQSIQLVLKWYLCLLHDIFAVFLRKYILNIYISPWLLLLHKLTKLVAVFCPSGNSLSSYLHVQTIPDCLKISESFHIPVLFVLFFDHFLCSKLYSTFVLKKYQKLHLFFSIQSFLVPQSC